MLALLMLVADSVQGGELAQPRHDAFNAMRYGFFIHNVYKLTAPPVGVKLPKKSTGEGHA